MKPLKRVVIKEELVELTGDYRPALILNQFIYWIERMYDADKYILEEKERALKEDMEINISESKGWVYKTAEELSEELMTGMSKSTIGRYIKQLVEKGYLHQRRNPKYKWDKTMQYRVDLYKVQLDLAKLGYALEGYRLLPNIQIVENVELEEEVFEEVESVVETISENKKSLTYGEVKDNENKEVPTCDEAETDNLENLIDDNIIHKNEEKYTYNLIENKENISSECEDDDIEAKNKRLMEEEKVFVPNFNFKPNINADWD